MIIMIIIVTQKNDNNYLIKDNVEGCALCRLRKAGKGGADQHQLPAKHRRKILQRIKFSILNGV